MISFSQAEDQKKLLFEANERATASLVDMKRRVQGIWGDNYFSKINMLILRFCFDIA